MSSEGGNLVFHTGTAKNIEFRTGSQGRIKLNEEDLADVFSQVMIWICCSQCYLLLSKCNSSIMLKGDSENQI